MSMDTFLTHTDFEFKKKNQQIAMINERGYWAKQSHTYWQENFNLKPALIADVLFSVNQQWDLTGTNAVSADVGFAAGGGVTLTSHGANADSTIIKPRAAASWGTAQNFLTQKSPRFEAWIRTPATITTMEFWVKLGLTNDPVIATDDDQFMVKFSTTAPTGGSATNLMVITSRAGVDVITVLPIVVTASTLYRIGLTLNGSLTPSIRITSTFQPVTSAGVALVGSSVEQYSSLFNLISGYKSQSGASGNAALVTAKDLIPFVGVKQLAGSITRAIDVLEVKSGRAA